MDLFLMITLMLLTVNPVKSHSDTQVQEPAGYAGQSTTFFLMQQVFKLDEKFRTKLKHMEEDIEELKSKAINQEGKELREDIGEMKSEIESLSQDLKSAKRELLDSNAALKQETTVLQEKISDLQKAVSGIHSSGPKISGRKGLCPKSWTRFGDSCYKINTEKKDWLSALLKCWDEGGYLAEIDDEDENQFLKEEATNVQEDLWLGGSDIAQEGEWHWVTSKKKISAGSFTDWPPGQPSDGYGGEHCLHLYKGLQYRWNDVTCADKYGYVCEMQTGLE